MKDIYEIIAKATPEKNKELLENIREFLMKAGRLSNRPQMIEWAKNLSYDGLIYCLHFGFSEKAFLESLSGIFKLEEVEA